MGTGASPHPAGTETARPARTGDDDDRMIDSAQVRAFGGGDRSGPNPVDRRKPGTKDTVLVDAHGTPLAMQSAAANISDHRQILSTVVRYPQIGGTPGRPRNHSTKLYADAG